MKKIKELEANTWHVVIKVDGVVLFNTCVRIFKGNWGWKKESNYNGIKFRQLLTLEEIKIRENDIQIVKKN